MINHAEIKKCDYIKDNYSLHFIFGMKYSQLCGKKTQRIKAENKIR